MMACNCGVCQFAGEVDRAKRGTKAQMRAMIDTLYDRYVGEGMDRNWADAVIDGSWPDADEIIKFKRSRALIESPATPESR
jgi:hypothetical protein